MLHSFTLLLGSRVSLSQRGSTELVIVAREQNVTEAAVQNFMPPLAAVTGVLMLGIGPGLTSSGH